MVLPGLQEIVRLLHAAQIVSRNLTASLAFLAWDICITLDQEVEYIWIATQGVATHFAHIIPVPLHLCRSFFLFQFVSAVLTIIAADIIFMIRVYALYNRKLWVAVTMASLLAVETIACAVLIPYSLPRVIFNPFCFITLPPRFNVAFSVISLMPPFTAFLFIAVKQITSIRDGWGNTPLMVLLMRDTTWGIAGLLAVWLTNPLIAILIGKPLAHVGHLWFMSIIPSIGCRVILNMQRFKSPAETTNDFQLTTPIAGFEQESHEMTSSSKSRVDPQPNHQADAQ